MIVLNGEDQARLSAYCGLLDIYLPSTEPNPALALQILARMYLVPTIDAKSDRNKALNEIRGNLRGHFDERSAFVGQTARVAAEMQEFPLWFMAHHTSTEVLIEQYKSLSVAIKILAIIGVGGTTTAIGGGLAEWSKTGSAKAGAIKAGRRAIGQGPLFEETERRLRSRGRKTPARGGAVGIMVAVGATLLYHNAIEKQEKIREIILHRYLEGRVTDDQYREVFADTFDPSFLKRYWEM